MSAFVKGPSFQTAQPVCFVGGEGIVRSYKSEAETWIYLVEMALGPEPEFGRIGPEAMVLLIEADLYAI
jgi:hypothetical protein